MVEAYMLVIFILLTTIPIAIIERKNNDKPYYKQHAKHSISARL